MNILFNIGSLEKGGAERVIANLSNYLKKDNNITIMTTLKKDIKYKLDNSIELEELEKSQESKNLIVKNVKRLIKMNNIIKKKKPDIIISFLPEPCFRILFLKLFNRKLKVIISVRNDPKVEYKSFARKMIMKLLYPLANGVVFQTEEAKEFFNKKIQDKSIIIPNPIGEKFLNTNIKNEKKNEIINVGRLEEQKNQQMIIKAFSNISKKFPQYILKIYGEGSLRNKLEQLISSLDMNDKIFLMGNIDEIQDKMNDADIFVLASKYEGMPNALMEAMAMGMACISTDCPCGGPKFLIKNFKNGILIENENQEELEKNLEKLIKENDFKQRIKNNALKIRSELGPDLINEKWYKYIKEINGG